MITQEQFDDLVCKCFYLLNGVVNPGVRITRHVNILNTNEFIKNYNELIGNATDDGIPLAITVDYKDGTKELVVVRDHIFEYINNCQRYRDNWETIVLFLICHELSHAEQVINYNAYNNSFTYRDAAEMGADGNAYRFMLNYTQWLANHLNIKINVAMLYNDYYETALETCIMEEKVKFCQDRIYW